MACCRIGAIATTVYLILHFTHNLCNVYDGLFGVALSRKLILLTRNHRDFSKIPRLLIEDWTV
ncbi:hypothetical protein [Nostoc sp.]|uniref:hypothetical protein n=1 Tax=Nostoc sp. TaxID=1180 RepID=UPI002FF70885